MALVLGIDGFDALARTDQDSADAALRRLAGLLLDPVRGSDLCWRSGTRVACLLNGAARDVALGKEAELRQLFSQPAALPGGHESDRLTLSAGMARVKGSVVLAGDAAYAAGAMAEMSGGDTCVEA